MREVVASGFKTLRTVHLTSKTKNIGRPEVYEDAEMEALLEKDSCQTQEEQNDGQYFE